MAFGVGTFASRGAVTSGTAVKLAADQVASKAVDVAAHMLNIDADTVVLERGRVVDSADPSRSVTLGDVAAALIPATPLAAKFGVGLAAEEYWVPPAVTVASGTHVVTVDVDRQTGKVSILRYIVAHDCGHALNPMVVHGQVQGGVAHGIGCTLMEEVAYGDDAVPTTVDFGTYPLATMPDVPDVEIIDLDYPTYLNPLGAKGVGEGGAVGAGPALANAICDALRPLDIEISELPITSERLRALVVAAEAAAASTTGAAESAVPATDATVPATDATLSATDAGSAS
jgi:carbon-monoxide dehydrogenase large subunit